MFDTGSADFSDSASKLWQVMFMTELIIYTDGACSGNPGPGGWGAIVYNEGRVSELGGGEAATTNNRMEMLSIFEALQFCLKAHPGQAQITVYTDSVYVIKGMTEWIHGWKRRGWKNAENEAVANQDLWQQLDELAYRLKQKSFKLNWKFVKGHSGVEGNERCDQIAVAFSKNEWVDRYTGSAESYRFDILKVPETRPLPQWNRDATAEKKPAWYISYVNGVFSKHQTWAECESLVKGRAAQFKKVTSLAEEEEMKKKWGVPQ